MAGYEDMALPEVEDAVAAYDDLLAFREFLAGGEVLNYQVPRELDDGVVWSGMRLGDRAVIRIFKQGGGTGRQEVRPWGEKTFELEAAREGRSYLLERSGEVKVAAG